MATCEYAIALDPHDGRSYFLRDQIRPGLRRVYFHKQKVICCYLFLGAVCGLILMIIGAIGGEGAISASGPTNPFSVPIYGIGTALLMGGLMTSWIWSVVNTARLRRWGWLISLFIFYPLLVYLIIGPETPPEKKRRKQKH